MLIDDLNSASRMHIGINSLNASFRQFFVAMSIGWLIASVLECRYWEGVSSP